MLAVEYISAETNFKLVVGPTEEVAWNVYVELYATLGQPLCKGEGNKINCNPLFKRSSIDIKMFQNMCGRYRNNELWQFYSKISKLGSHQHFLILLCDSEAKIPESKMIDIHAMLVALNMGKDIAMLQTNLREYCANVRRYYDVIACLDCSKPMKIGANAEDRFCRFCGRLRKDGVEFTKDAHVISKMLGNSSVLGMYECDDCNGGVVHELEESISTYFKFLRTMMGVRGRGGVAKIAERDFEMSNVTGRDVEIKIKDENVEDIPDEQGGLGKILTIPCGKLIPQHIYRLLAKFAVSVIDEGEFDRDEFKHLTDWIVGVNQYCGALPLVAVRTETKWNPHVPRITVYRRRTSASATVPKYLCDFFAVCERFMFELPFVDGEAVLKDKESWAQFFDECSVICDGAEWQLTDFSSSVEQDFANRIVLHAKERRPAMHMVM